MKSVFTGGIVALGLLAASMAGAEVMKLTPANPQPGGLKPGLSVVYGYAKQGRHIKTLADARSVLRSAQGGPPLRGLDYRDTNEGEPTLTSSRAENVAASIKGYIRFDAPGVYEIDFFTNDGLNATISGQTVGYFDGRQTCDTTYVTEVEVPQAGWYEFQATYFNRLKTSCLMMRMGPKGQQRQWVSNAVFGRK